MNNFRRRVMGDRPKEFVKQACYVNLVIINSYTPPEDATYNYTQSGYFGTVGTLNITIDYDLYDCYSDGSAEFVERSTRTIETSTNLKILRGYSSSHSINMEAHASNGTSTFDGKITLYVRTSNLMGADIYTRLSDEDGTVNTTLLHINGFGSLVRYGLWEDKVQSAEASSLNFCRITMTKLGASGSGNVLVHYESLL